MLTNVKTFWEISHLPIAYHNRLLDRRRPTPILRLNAADQESSAVVIFTQGAIPSSSKGLALAVLGRFCKDPNLPKLLVAQLAAIA